VAVALSGSSQHMAGCSGSETIVSINKDPSANIFREAKFGVVGDWKMVLPTFIKKIVELSKRLKNYTLPEVIFNKFGDSDKVNLINEKITSLKVF
jgi:hypothetical protein